MKQMVGMPDYRICVFDGLQDSVFSYSYIITVLCEHTERSVFA